MTDTFGVHASIAGGLHNALIRSAQLQCCVAQIFTKNQQQWRCRPLEQAAIDEWLRHHKQLKFGKIVSHDSYLINLASPDEQMWRRSVSLFIEELRRCRLLGIPYLVTHPGAHLGAGEQAGLRRVVKALDLAYDAVGPCKVITCLEVTAGQGSSLGYKLEHLVQIISHSRHAARLGVCLDTAHLFAAGYDFRGRKYAAFRRQLEKTVGLRRIKVLHLNDSKKPLGSRVDRHDHIGQGLIGLNGFRPFVRDQAFSDVPKILETPKARTADGRDWDEVNLQTLRSLA
ncbi:deoxyribonuclease IV [Fontivita pretiosa]|uniref:deoxyribonuclease IV n=1 Tax=Fontivita pretiosa TaxID=2989684 RepID=UPI003D1841FC